MISEDKVLFRNAIDSLKIGMEFYLKDEYEYSHKHAILTIFHSIELFLKEYLYRINPILIYKNIDKPIGDDSLTVNIDSLFVRLENLEIGLPKEYKEIIGKIRKRRNRIEHHKYERGGQDQFIIGEALKFVTYFVEKELKECLKEYINVGLLNKLEKAIYDYETLLRIADARLEEWIEKQLPEGKQLEDVDIFDCFEGTVDCPECNNTYLVLDILPKPFCFYCNKDIDASCCEECGNVYFSQNCCVYCVFPDDLI